MEFLKRLFGVNRTIEPVKKSLAKCKLGFHQYGEWELIDIHAKLKKFCEVQQKCKVCGEVNIMKPQPHSWQEWVSHASGGQVRYCKRCKIMDYRASSLDCRGNHDWGEWIPQIPNSCIRERICSNCREKETKGQHNWTKWKYQGPNSCIEERSCRLCQRKEEQVIHAWETSAEYQAPDSCRKVQICRRCQTELSGFIEIHSWGEWISLAPDSCIKAQICERCKAQGSVYKEFHSWGEWEFQTSSSCLQKRICKHCQRKEEQVAHVWRDWKNNLDSLWQERICSRCQSKEKRPIDSWTLTLQKREMVPPFQRQIMLMLDELKPQREIEDLIRKTVDISPNARIGFCSCGFPTTEIFRDGSFSTIKGLTNEKTLDRGQYYETHYYCPKCGELIKSWVL